MLTTTNSILLMQQQSCYWNIVLKKANCFNCLLICMFSAYHLFITCLVFYRLSESIFSHFSDMKIVLEYVGVSTLPDLLLWYLNLFLPLVWKNRDLFLVNTIFVYKNLNSQLYFIFIYLFNKHSLPYMPGHRWTHMY